MDASALYCLLACPDHREPVTVDGTTLRARCGCSFPIVAGVPLMLPEHRRPHRDLLQQVVAQDIAAEQALRSGAAHVDPVVAWLVPHTCGNAYLGQRDRLRRYPIPPIGLGPGREKLFLDVGCGWGRWAFAAERAGFAAVGVDRALTPLLAARRVARQLGMRACFVAGDARTLPFVDGAFGAAHSYSVLQHLSHGEALQALDEMVRVLGGGAECLVQLAHRAGLRSFYQLAARGFRRPRPGEVSYWSMKQIAEAAQTRFSSYELSVDCFFGLGLQRCDRDLMDLRGRIALALSEILTGASARWPAFARAADSVFVRGRK